ncbi:hypothetical protein FD50_GL000066 [Liquorilactobacillus satsumensis DSM 16230 = JCM 12392]|uniref:Uncharacterized protein n=2 Tax=Liquorilactobacillus satsumensis TaxID=259059 RepID=A0A0R1V816_9LACO|nr:hypothetical protein FD50_GL000066 [Liquorilactobacillus satsumensis DSM 16230 = JCM 12392]
MQLFLAKSEDMESKEPKEQLQDFLVMTEEVEGYVKKTLKLNDKQYEKLEEMEFEETVELANKIASKMLGIDPEAAEKVAKKPKK